MQLCCAVTLCQELTGPQRRVPACLAVSAALHAELAGWSSSSEFQDSATVTPHTNTGSIAYLSPHHHGNSHINYLITSEINGTISWNMTALYFDNINSRKYWPSRENIRSRVHNVNPNASDTHSKNLYQKRALTCRNLHMCQSIWNKFFSGTSTFTRQNTALFQHRNCLARDANHVMWLAKELF